MRDRGLSTCMIPASSSLCADKEGRRFFPRDAAAAAAAGPSAIVLKPPIGDLSSLPCLVTSPFSLGVTRDSSSTTWWSAASSSARAVPEGGVWVGLGSGVGRLETQER